MELVSKREFANGVVYCLRLDDGMLVETTDTFLPAYTKDAKANKTNALTSKDLGSRAERWMIGVSVMSGCPVRCKFCATGNMKKWRNLTWLEILGQITFVLRSRRENPENSVEFKINYTRMGEPFLNIKSVRRVIDMVSTAYPNTHHYVSTIGIKDADYSWIKDNITLQVSLHSLDAERRNDLIPYLNKVSIEELGQIRTDSALKTTLNLTLVDEKDFDINALVRMFDPKAFFVKLSPINPNDVSDANGMGEGIIQTRNVA